MYADMQDKDTFIREITKNLSQNLAIAGGGESHSHSVRLGNLDFVILQFSLFQVWLFMINLKLNDHNFAIQFNYLSNRRKLGSCFVCTCIHVHMEHFLLHQSLCRRFGLIHHFHCMIKNDKNAHGFSRTWKFCYL